MKLSRPALLAAMLAGVLLLGVVAVAVLSSAASRPRLERLASTALDMEVHIGGATHVRVLPRLGLSADDVHLQRDGAELGSARRARIAVSLLSLLHGPRRIAAVVLEGATLSMQQGPDGRFNFQRPGNAARAPREIELARFAVTDGALVYTTANGAESARFDGCDLTLEDVHVSAEDQANVLQRLSTHGRGTCQQMRTRDMQVTDAKFSVTTQAGKFTFAPIALRAYGGDGTAELRADLSGKTPAYQVRYDLKKFRIEQWLRVFSQKQVAAGDMDFTARLSMHGRTLDDLKHSSDGTVSLRGRQLALQIGDLDRDLGRYESTQQFNLVDLGAILLGGPAGVLVTKGYDFARVLHGPGGTSEVPLLVSDWRLQDGKAQATDVALTTVANRVALKGDLDLAGGRFGDVTVAVLDKDGCARVQQKVRGRFGQPEIDKPNVLMALTGPARRLVAEAKKNLLGSHCEPFYTGSVAQPPPPIETRSGIAAILP